MVSTLIGLWPLIVNGEPLGTISGFSSRVNFAEAVTLNVSEVVLAGPLIGLAVRVRL